MQKWGKTAIGKQRYRCNKCSVTTINSRPDCSSRINQKVFVQWVTSSDRQTQVAKHLKVTRRTVINRFHAFWKHSPQPLPIRDHPSVIVVDGVSVVKHNLVALIIVRPDYHKPIGWAFTLRENYDSWVHTLSSIAGQGVNPQYLVCDGQRGLLKAIMTIWPRIRIQRCLIHIVRQAKLWLTLHPQTETGIKLLDLVRDLLHIRTRRQKRKWLRRFRRWMKKHEAFLKERTYHPTKPKKWWYTHRKLRAVRSLLKNSLPNLFVFIGHSQVPRTSNHVEGGVNSRLKDLLRIHRGLSPQRQRVLVAWYLAVRQGQKPTRNFT